MVLLPVTLDAEAQRPSGRGGRDPRKIPHASDPHKKQPIYTLEKETGNAVGRAAASATGCLEVASKPHLPAK
jgi:hypothetical protein